MTLSISLQRRLAQTSLSVAEHAALRRGMIAERPAGAVYVYEDTEASLLRRLRYLADINDSRYLALSKYLPKDATQLRASAPSSLAAYASEPQL